MTRRLNSGISSPCALGREGHEREPDDRHADLLNLSPLMPNSAAPRLQEVLLLGDLHLSERRIRELVARGEQDVPVRRKCPDAHK